MKYYNEVNEIRSGLNLSWDEFAEKIGTTGNNLRTNLRKLDSKKDRKRQPVAWNLVIFLKNQKEHHSL